MVAAGTGRRAVRRESKDEEKKNGAIKMKGRDEDEKGIGWSGRKGKKERGKNRGTKRRGGGAAAGRDEIKVGEGGGGGGGGGRSVGQVLEWRGEENKRVKCGKLDVGGSN